MEEHIYYHKQIVIGSNLNAVLYAYKTNSIFINNSMDSLFPFDEVGFSLDLGYEIIGPKTKVRNIFNSLCYRMSLEGRTPFSDLVETVRILPEENQLDVITKNSRLIKYEYEKLRLFDSNNIIGMPFDDETSFSYYRVLDWFNVRSGMNHEYDHLITEDNFCKKIYFYLSKRIDGNKRYKDLVVESIMTEEQLNNFDYSDTIARIKTTSIMSEADIKGTGNGAGRNLPIRLELRNREIIPIKTFFRMEHNNIIFDNRDVLEIAKTND